ncbi:hypothetical protein EUX98_g4046 [Antrodiella citrinella]|uniref:Uncharacterized protein n=1 Tax=Antrodiella citrinella TaxID=2447956 RepID=A0A4V6S1V5_9APHY|nr:hypothetical protein EUX98_g4046 [Antrodiella citrinella]
MCFKKRTIEHWVIPHLCPGGLDIPHLLPHCIIPSEGNRKYYWKEDVVSMHKTLSLYQTAASGGELKAMKKLKNFKTSGKARVAAILAHALAAGDWKKICSEAREEAKNRVRTELKARLDRSALDCTEEDIDTALRKCSPDIKKPPTAEYWAPALQRLQNGIMKAKSRRIEREHEDIRADRRMLVREAFSKFMKQFKLRDSLCYPDFKIMADGPFHSLIHQDYDTELQQDDINRVDSQLTNFVEEYRAKVKSSLMAKLSNLAAPPSSSLSSLDLAIAVFSCGSCAVPKGMDGMPFLVFSYAEAALHHHGQKDGNALTRHHSASRATTFVLRCLSRSNKNLNPHSSTPSDLDEVDARVMCGSCPEVLQNGQGRSIFKWRSYVVHHVMTHGSKSIPNPERLSLEEERRVKSKEGTVNLKKSKSNAWYHTTFERVRAFHSVNQFHADFVLPPVPMGSLALATRLKRDLITSGIRS